MKLGDNTTKESIKGFLDEARACAQYRKDDGVNVHGYAAMLTAFTCILSIGEMLVRHRYPEMRCKRLKDEVCLREFYKEMEAVVDWHSWLFFPEDGTTDDIKSYRGKSYRDEPCELLYDLRNALVHAISIHPYVAMVPDKEWAKSEQFRDKCRIVVPDFVSAVERTFERIVDDNKNSEVPWDPLSPSVQTSVRRLTTFISTGNSAGSPAIDEGTTAPVDTKGITELGEYINRLSGNA